MTDEMLDFGESICWRGENCTGKVRWNGIYDRLNAGFWRKHLLGEGKLDCGSALEWGEEQMKCWILEKASAGRGKIGLVECAGMRYVTDEMLEFWRKHLPGTGNAAAFHPP